MGFLRCHWNHPEKYSTEAIKEKEDYLEKTLERADRVQTMNELKERDRQLFPNEVEPTLEEFLARKAEEERVLAEKEAIQREKRRLQAERRELDKLPARVELPEVTQVGQMDETRAAQLADEIKNVTVVQRAIQRFLVCRRLLLLFLSPSL